MKFDNYFDLLYKFEAGTYRYFCFFDVFKDGLPLISDGEISLKKCYKKIYFIIGRRGAFYLFMHF